MTTPSGQLAPCYENLAEGALRIAHEQEKRLGHLAEVAEVLLGLIEPGGAPSPRALLSAAAAALSADAPVYPLDPSIPDSHTGVWQAALSATAALDRAGLSVALCRRMAEHFGRPLSLAEVGDGVLPPPSHSRVVYVRNPLSDAAYSRLSAMLPSPTVGYRQSIRELFDDVAHHYADYAILPLLSDGVAVQSVLSLLEEYGLKLGVVTPVATENGEILFALVSRGALLGRPPEFFTLSLPPDRNEELSCLLTALPALGASLLRMDAVPLSYDRARLAYCITVLGDADAFIRLSVYLSLYAPGYTGYGFYTQL